jgi:hypothetical protein
VRIIVYLLAIILFSGVIGGIVYLYMLMFSSTEFSASDPKVIYAVEEMLRDMDMNPGLVDGNADPMLKEAIKEFQVVADMPETGEIDQNLFDELKAMKELLSGN